MSLKRRRSLIGSAIKADTGRRDNSAETGLLPGHCYPIVALKEIHLPRIGERMFEGKTLLR